MQQDEKGSGVTVARASCFSCKGCRQALGRFVGPSVGNFALLRASVCCLYVKDCNNIERARDSSPSCKALYTAPLIWYFLRSPMYVGPWERRSICFFRPFAVLQSSFHKLIRPTRRPHKGTVHLSLKMSKCFQGFRGPDPDLRVSAFGPRSFYIGLKPNSSTPHGTSTNKFRA